MKKILILLLLVILFSSCSLVREMQRQRQMYDIWFPGKAAQIGKTPCNMFPKPIYKN